MDIQDGNWQVGRREEEFTTGDGTSRMELAGREDGKRIYHRRWDIQDGNWQVGRGKRIYHRRWDIQDGNWQVGKCEDEFTTGDGHPGWELAGRRREENLPQEMGHPGWELAGRETGRGIYHRRWDIQDGNWQVGRREEEFTTGDGTSRMGTGR